MLGVATMIVVNSVMAGFTHEMQTGSTACSPTSCCRATASTASRRRAAHGRDSRAWRATHIAGMSPTVHVPAMLYIRSAANRSTRQVMLVGVDEATYAIGQRLRQVTCSTRRIASSCRSICARTATTSSITRSAIPRQAERRRLASRRLGVSPDRSMPNSARARTHAARELCAANRRSRERRGRRRRLPATRSTDHAAAATGGSRRRPRRSIPQRAAPGHRARHRRVQLPRRTDGDRPLLIVPGDDVIAELSHGGAAAARCSATSSRSSTSTKAR